MGITRSPVAWIFLVMFNFGGRASDGIGWLFTSFPRTILRLPTSFGDFWGLTFL
jgi:SNF family Na+-dependent transporter